MEMYDIWLDLKTNISFLCFLYFSLAFLFFLSLSVERPLLILMTYLMLIRSKKGRR